MFYKKPLSLSKAIDFFSYLEPKLKKRNYDYRRIEIPFLSTIWKRRLASTCFAFSLKKNNFNKNQSS